MARDVAVGAENSGREPEWWAPASIIPSSSPFVALAATVLKGTAGGLHQCAKWDAAGWQVLVSNFFGVGMSKLRAVGTAGKEKEEERVVSGVSELQRRREGRAGVRCRHAEGALLVVYADRMPRFRYSAHNSDSLPEFTAHISVSRTGADRTCRTLAAA
uniref:Uncharacterized protein n=1 Tax=Oryza glumipatula TaxID=40148 RepID=A0A0D9ZIQ1_9ORYZ